MFRFSAFFALLCVFCPTATATVVSDFNADLDGWTATGSGSLSHSVAGGNPDGFAQFDDMPGVLAGDGFLIAPAKFLGDWSALDGVGSLQWDHRILTLGDAPTIVNASAAISGPGGQATYFGTLHQTTWTTFSAPISSGDWVIGGGTWNAILANVASLTIRIEAVHNDGAALDVDGIDNVGLVPEPGTLTLLVLGALLVASPVVHRRWRTAAS